MSWDYDLVIAGGGMVGASLAAALAPLDLRIAVVETHQPDAAEQPSFDERSTAVAYGSRVILETIGCWEAISPQATPIDTIHISERGRPGISRIAAREQGVPALGYVVPNRVIGHAVWPLLESASNIELLTPASVEGVEIDAGEAVLSVAIGDGTRRITTGLLIAADGARSRLREALGVDASVSDYRQNAVVTTIATARPHRNTAYERFTDTGPLAVLPLDDDRCSVVWTVARETCDTVLGWDDDAFMAKLQEQFGFRLGEIERVARRAAYPLYLVQAQQQTRPRAVLLGNAAHGLHPVAGQGFNLSLRDVAALAETLAEHGDDPGGAKMLAQYDDWRRADQKKVIAFTDGLVRLFTNPLAPVRGARNAGLIMFELLPGAKRLFARHTMGRAGKLPRLARGVPLV